MLRGDWRLSVHSLCAYAASLVLGATSTTASARKEAYGSGRTARAPKCWIKAFGNTLASTRL